MPKNRRPGTLKDFRILEKTLQKNSKIFFLVCKFLKNIHTHCCLLIFIQFNFFPCLFLFFRSLTIPEWSKPTLNVLPLSNTHPQMFSYHVLLFFYLFIFFQSLFTHLSHVFVHFPTFFLLLDHWNLKLYPETRALMLKVCLNRICFGFLLAQTTPPILACFWGPLRPWGGLTHCSPHTFSYWSHTSWNTLHTESVVL